ncbi:alpha/beta fold hydrolase [Roseinatronobacter alkalisoli]|uniref:Alpha/beta fold hydrolase n=1 Tax=Roseinatronobacter alkalisoli TaxID=3028235 RepID=A0ABT5TF30_9RHOB|nr:alpha/beta fold hydrolase [Roseinatronobacter sp. HJB301]MDD7972513.1 alpha/beta fold hydrolase [Roseinatronobacter sp. HJB301]
MTLTLSASRLAALAFSAILLTACMGVIGDRMANAQTQPEGAFVTLPEGRIHAIIRGHGPDLVLIHGANGNARDFSFGLIDRMAADFRVIALDRPGFGFSDDFGGPEGPLEQADILRAAVAELGVERPILLGHSYGGAVALAWALRAGDDVAGLTLLAPASHPWPGDLGLWYRISASALGRNIVLPLVAQFAPDSAVTATLDGVFSPNPVPDGYLDHLGRDLTLRADQLALNARQVNSLKTYVDGMAPGYPALTIPIEVVHGTSDETVGMSIHSERLEQEVSSVNLTRLEGVGHMPHHARPEAVADAILRTAQRAGLIR